MPSVGPSWKRARTSAVERSITRVTEARREAGGSGRVATFGDAGSRHSMHWRGVQLGYFFATDAGRLNSREQVSQVKGTRGLCAASRGVVEPTAQAAQGRSLRVAACGG